MSVITVMIINFLRSDFIFPFQKRCVYGEAIADHLGGIEAGVTQIGVGDEIGEVEVQVGGSVLAGLHVGEGGAEPGLGVQGGATASFRHASLEAVEGSVEVEDGVVVQLQAVGEDGFLLLCDAVGLGEALGLGLHVLGLVQG